MKKLQMIIAVLSVGAFCSFGLAQNAAPAKKPQPVIKQIPAGALGFLVINDVKAFTDSLDKFLVDIGLGEVAKSEMPDGSLREIMDKMAAGEGFNPSGGFALVMLDPTTVGMDLMDIFPPELGGKDADFRDWGPPFVAFVPGESFAKAFPKAEKPKEKHGNKYDTVDIGFGPLLSTQMGDYVLLSPQEKALDAVINAPKKLSDGLSKAEFEMLSRNQVALNLNIQVCGPILEKIFKKLDEEIKKKESALNRDETSALTLLGFVRPYLSQFKSLSLCARIDASAVVIDAAADFTADGAIGKALAAYKGAKPALDKLPNLGYVLAAGAVVVDQKLAADSDAAAIDMMTKLIAVQGQNISDDLKARLTKSCMTFDEQVTGMQVVFGQATKSAGLFGLAMTFDCKDSAKFQANCSDITGVLNDLVKAIGGDDPDVKDLKITYTQAAETVGNVKVDVMELTSPTMVKNDKDRQEMVKIIGEDKMRFFIAPTGANSVVVTFGGGKAFLEEALKSSSGTGTIGKDIPAEAMKALPANLTTIMVFSASNLIEFIAKAQAVHEENPDASKLPKLGKTPLVIGGGCQDSACVFTVFGPTSVIKDIIMSLMETKGEAPAAAPAAPPAPPVAPK